MKRIPKIALLISVLLICGCGTGIGGLSVSTGRSGTNYYAMGETIASLLSEVSDKKASALESSGSDENIRTVISGMRTFGIAQSDILSNAYFGDGMFSGTPTKSVRAVAGLYPEAVQVIVRKDSDIASIADLSEHIVSVGDSGSGTEENAIHILMAYGVSEATVTTVNLSTAEACESLKNQEIDAFFYTSGAPAKIIADLAEEEAIRVLPIQGSVLDTLLGQYAYFREYSIAAGTYHGQEEAVETIAVPCVLITSESTDAELVYQLTKKMYEQPDRVTGAVSIPFDFQPDANMDFIPIPFHEGAARYYQELGIETKQ